MLAEFLGTAWALPVFGMAFGIVGLAWALYASRRMDQKYGKDR